MGNRVRPDGPGVYGSGASCVGRRKGEGQVSRTAASMGDFCREEGEASKTEHLRGQLRWL